MNLIVVFPSHSSFFLLNDNQQEKEKGKTKILNIKEGKELKKQQNLEKIVNLQTEILKNKAFIEDVLYHQV